VANYAGGSVSVLPIGEDGRLGELTDLVQHHGSSANPQRQKSPHPHSANLDAANRYLFVPDLGLDKIMIYRIDSPRGKLKPNDEPWARVKAGAGPRHFAFHPKGRYAYVINELDSTVTAFAFDETRGTLKEIQTVPTLPDSFTGNSTCADVHVSPSGKFLYGSNRGHDSIVIFAIDEDTGQLTYVEHEPTQGKTPRNFAIDPTGTFLLAANQNSDTVVTFRIDPVTGRLSPTGHVASVPSPVCLKLVPISP
jgi:6-phosphogluconolactonase